MPRLAVVATADISKDVTKALAARPNLDVVCVIGRRNDDYRATSVSRSKPLTGTRGLITERLLDGSSPQEDTRPQEQLARDILLFAEHMARRDPDANYRGHKLTSLHDYIDYYHVMTAAYRAEFTQKSVDTVLFFNLPHLGYDTAAYLVARAMGLKVLIVGQSQIANKFYSMQDIGSYGHLNPKKIRNAKPMPISRKEPDYFYMAGIEQKDGEKGGLSFAALRNILTYVIRREPLSLLKPMRLWSLMSRARAIGARFPKWRDPFARFFDKSAFAYFETLAGFEDTPVETDTPFVYVPLQLQPEMTTSTLGGIYNDQVLAIEKLRRMLPPDIRILVKENPKQGAYMRGALAFHRLSLLQNVQILPSYANTHELTAKASAVATISGTVGWEALCQGVPVILFGHSWYGDFPGVFRATGDVDFLDVAAFKIQPNALERAYGAFQEALHEGVVDKDYARLVDGFDFAANTTKLALTLEGLILAPEPLTSFDDQSPSTSMYSRSDTPSASAKLRAS